MWQRWLLYRQRCHGMGTIRLGLLPDAFGWLTAGATGWGYRERIRLGLVPAVRFLVRPGTAGRAVQALDVLQAPANLRGGVGFPVGARAGHLRAGHGLGDAVRTIGIRCGDAPAALPRPERVEAAELAGRPAEAAEHRHR